MPQVRLIHVSDTHLSRSHAYFADNWAAFGRILRANPPDLLVHGGDIAFNAPAVPGDLAYGATEIAALGIPWLAIAGNHDVGEAPAFSRLNQPVNAATLATWRQLVGPLWWLRDIGDWRLIGLDTALMGSDLPEEAAQTAFLHEALAGRGRRPVMVFVHIPPFDRDPGDTTHSTSVIPPVARAALLDTCAAGGVKVINCGHLHIYRRLRHRGMEIVWAPATAMMSVERGLSRACHRASTPRSRAAESGDSATDHVPRSSSQSPAPRRSPCRDGAAAGKYADVRS